MYVLLPGFDKLKTAALRFLVIFSMKTNSSASLELLLKAVAVFPFEQGVSTFYRTLFLEGRIPVVGDPRVGAAPAGGGCGSVRSPGKGVKIQENPFAPSGWECCAG